MSKQIASVVESSTKEWCWDKTAITDVQNILAVKEIKQLLISRGENMKKLKISKKIDLIQHLKTNHSVKLQQPLNNLTRNQLLAELKLLNIFDKNMKNLTKQELVTKLGNVISNCDENRPIIKWRQVEILGSIKDRLDLSDIKQLLINCGAKHNEIEGNKDELIKMLKGKYKVNLHKPLTVLTLPQIKIELKLYGEDAFFDWDNKRALICRLETIICDKVFILFG